MGRTHPPDEGGAVWPFLENVAYDDAQLVLALAQRRRFERGETICHEGDRGDTMHLIERGRVAIRATTRHGDVATFRVLGPGGTFGELALISDDHVRSATATALETSETLALHRRDFQQLRAEHPEVDQSFVTALASLVEHLSDQLMEALYLPVDTRVLRRVVDLALLYDEGKRPIEIPLTQEEIASLAGTARATANRVLRDAERAGHLQLQRGRVAVVNLGELDQACR